MAIILGQLARYVIFDFDEAGAYEEWLARLSDETRRYVEIAVPIIRTPKGFIGHVYLPLPSEALAEGGWFRERVIEVGADAILARYVFLDKDGNEDAGVRIELRVPGKHMVMAPGSAFGVHDKHPERTWVYAGTNDKRIEHLPDHQVVTGELFTEMVAAAAAQNDPRAAEVLKKRNERRAALHHAAKRIGDLPPEERASIESALKHVARNANADRAGDDFNARASWPDVLGSAGWVECGVYLWRRPGGSGTTASTKFGALAVFSPNAWPLEPTGHSRPAYSKFAAFALLYHGGDFSAAAKELSKAGYGKQKPKRKSRSKGSKDKRAKDRGAQQGDPVAPRAPFSAGASSLASELELTDTGNAVRFRTLAARNLRHCRSWRKWLWWTGEVWRLDTIGKAQALTKAVVENLVEQGLAVQDEDDGDLLKWGTKSAGEARRKAMLTLAECEPGIPVDPSEFNTHPWLLNCQNGTLELKTQTLRPHRREDLLTKLVPTAFLPDAPAPEWEKFLAVVIPHPEIRAFIQRIIGYSITGDQSEQVVFFLVGEGSNGKTTLINAVLNAIGTDYAIQVSSELLLKRIQRGHPTEIADLFGVRIAVCTETGQQAGLDEVLIKSLSGGDKIRARRMREDFWEFEATHHLLIATNHRPSVQGTDHAIWRRIVVIPFLVTITAAEHDHDLPVKLRNEAAGILAWAVRGLADWLANGLQIPKSVTQTVAEYRADMDVIGQFLEGCCDSGDLDAREGATPLYVAYKGWCETHGEDILPQRLFAPELVRRGFVRIKSHGRITYGGLRLRTPAGSPSPGGGWGGKTIITPSARARTHEGSNAGIPPHPPPTPQSPPSYQSESSNGTIDQAPAPAAIDGLHRSANCVVEGCAFTVEVEGAPAEQAASERSVEPACAVNGTADEQEQGLPASESPPDQTSAAASASNPAGRIDPGSLPRFSPQIEGGGDVNPRRDREHVYQGSDGHTFTSLELPYLGNGLYVTPAGERVRAVNK